ncbi:MAG: hypothetical protein LH660_15575 [Phormidesmis sp. CAN_BIN36]|nr:hypothetical protein [Phormidesmis sp. CAN_BIN36]
MPRKYLRLSLWFRGRDRIAELPDDLITRSLPHELQTESDPTTHPEDGAAIAI